MLNSFRKFSTTKFAKIFLGLVALSFVVAGAAGVISLNSNTIAEVGNEKISVYDLQKTYNNYIQQQGLEANNENKNRIFDSIVNSLIENSKLLQASKKIGFEVSEKDIKDEIKNMEYFKTNGIFDHNKFKQILKANNLTSEKLINLIREQKLTEFYSSFKRPNEKLINLKNIEKYMIQNTAKSRKGLVATMDFEKIKIKKPSDKKLQEHYEVIKKTYDNDVVLAEKLKSLQKKDISYLIIDKNNLSKSITNDDVNKYFDKNKGDYKNLEETRTYFNITGDKKTLEKIVNEYNKAPSFKTLKDSVNKNLNQNIYANRIYLLNKDSISNLETAKIVFNLKKDALSKINSGDFSNYLIYVSDIKPKGYIDEKEVKIDIKSLLKENKINEIIDLIDNSKKNLEEVSKKYNIKLENKKSITFSKLLSLLAAKINSSDKKFNDTIKEFENMFSLKGGEISDLIELNSTKSIIFNVKKDYPSKYLEFKEVKKTVEKHFVNEERNKKIKDFFDNTLNTVNDEKSFKKLVKKFGFKTNSQEVKKNGEDLLSFLFFQKDLKKVSSYISKEEKSKATVVFTNSEKKIKNIDDAKKAKISKDISGSIAYTFSQSLDKVDEKQFEVNKNQKLIDSLRQNQK